MRALSYDTAILGAGASGLMAAIVAASRNRSVVIIDHAPRPGQKIRISGGGRCNFTNRIVSIDNFVSSNPDFCRSALAGFTPADMIHFLKSARIPFEEKSQGQLFCSGGADRIADWLEYQARARHVEFCLPRTIKAVQCAGHSYSIQTDREKIHSHSLLIATGSPAGPKAITPSGFGYEIAKQFEIAVIPVTPALVPFQIPSTGDLSGISAEVELTCHKTFKDKLLFTHHGISGPAALQASLYWNSKETIVINFLPRICVRDCIDKARSSTPNRLLASVLHPYLSKRLLNWLLSSKLSRLKIAELSPKSAEEVISRLTHFRIYPSKTEGFWKAEVARGGVDTREISSKTMEAYKQPGLFFSGEVLDVTGELGGYNLQWAWASGTAAGHHL